MGEFYWAVLHYQKWWMFFDQAELSLVKSEELTGTNLRRIAANYRVARGIGPRYPREMPKPTAEVREQEMVRRTDGLAKLLRTRIKHWPTGLVERETYCREILETAKQHQFVHGNQISAITKLMWFLKPDAWTMFDDLAAEGLGVGKRVKPARSAAFYAKLHKLGFDQMVESIREALDATPLDGMPAGRVIDSFLVIRGTSERADEHRRLKAHAAGVPHEWRDGLEDAARRVDQAMQPYAVRFDT